MIFLAFYIVPLLARTLLFIPLLIPRPRGNPLLRLQVLGVILFVYVLLMVAFISLRLAIMPDISLLSEVVSRFQATNTDPSGWNPLFFFMIAYDLLLVVFLWMEILWPTLRSTKTLFFTFLAVVFLALWLLGLGAALLSGLYLAVSAGFKVGYLYYRHMDHQTHLSRLNEMLADN